MFFKKKDKIEWRNIINSYINHPRDVITVPLDREGKWFHVYADNDDLYIGVAADHSNTSNISQIRKLDKDKFEVMLDIFSSRVLFLVPCSCNNSSFVSLITPFKKL